MVCVCVCVGGGRGHGGCGWRQVGMAGWPEARGLEAHGGQQDRGRRGHGARERWCSECSGHGCCCVVELGRNRRRGRVTAFKHIHQATSMGTPNFRKSNKEAHVRMCGSALCNLCWRDAEVVGRRGGELRHGTSLHFRYRIAGMLVVWFACDDALGWNKVVCPVSDPSSNTGLRSTPSNA